MAAGSQENLGQFLESTDPDVALMLRARNDDSAAFEALVVRHQGRLVNLLAHLIGDDSAAEDLAREVFLRIHRTRKGYAPRTRFSIWLFRLAVNLANQRLRASDRDKAREPAHGSPRTREEAVRNAVASLDDDQRLAVLLSKFEEMRYAEIASVMNRSEAAVQSLLNQARLRLRDRLGPYLQSADSG